MMSLDFIVLSRLPFLNSGSVYVLRGPFATGPGQGALAMNTATPHAQFSFPPRQFDLFPHTPLWSHPKSQCLMLFQSRVHWSPGADRSQGSSPAVSSQEGRELQRGVDVGVPGSNCWEVGGREGTLADSVGG